MRDFPDLRGLALLAVGALAGCLADTAGSPPFSPTVDAPPTMPPPADAGPPDALIQLPGTISLRGFITDVLPITVLVSKPTPEMPTTVAFNANPLKPGYGKVSGSLHIADMPEVRTYMSSELVQSDMTVSIVDNGQTWTANISKPPAPPVGAIGPLVLTSVVQIGNTGDGAAIFEIHGELDASLAPTGAGTTNFISAHVVF